MTDLQSIPLNRLVQSPSNVRRTARGASLDGLMASLAAHGLRQNLNVKPTSGNRYEVVAGGRRLEAMRRLVKAGQMDAKHPVPCLVLEDGDSALEVSLAENAMRTDMHPDDQCEAFAGLIAEGMPSEDVAARFGVTPAVVAQRLKLAGVAPVLRKRFRGGELTLAQMMALALVDDHALQVEAYAQLPEWNRSPQAIRAQLTKEGVSARHRLCAFVGEEAYKAAGGLILRDLFDDEQGAVWADAALVHRLATGKLEDMGEAVRSEGWGWVRLSLDMTYEAFDRLEPVAGEHGPTYDSEQMKQAGARVMLDYSGELAVERGLMERGAARAAGSTERDEEDAPETGNIELPAAIVAELTAQKTNALRLELAAKPELALATLVHALGLALLYDRSGAGSCLTLNVRSERMDPYIRTAEDGTAAAGFAQLWEETTAGLPDEPGAFLDWCLEADRDRLLGLLALLTASMVNALQLKGDEHSARLAHASLLAQAIGLDMRRHWTPTVPGFFSRLTKPMLARILTEEGNGLQADAVGRMKRDEAAQKVEAALAPRGWLPPLLLRTTEEPAPDHE